MDGNNPPPTELGITQKDLGIAQDNVSEVPVKEADRLKLQKNQDGTITALTKDGKPLGVYEKGFLDLNLPSGASVNVVADSRLTGFQAEYRPDFGALVLAGATLSEAANLQDPAANQEARKDGWKDLAQRTEYFIKHEYNHFAWDQLDSLTQQKILGIFSKPERLASTRTFAAILISKPEYQQQEETDPNKPAYEFTFGGKVHRYSQERIINELLAHGVLGEIMGRDEMTQIQRSRNQAENFGARSKAAIDCLDKIKSTSSEDFDFLVESGLVSNPGFEQDYIYLLNVANSLHNNLPLGVHKVF